MEVQPFGIAVDCQGNSYVVGTFGSGVGLTTTFATVPPTTLTATGAVEVYLAKLDGSGAWVWALQSVGASGGTETRASGVAVDCQGSAYITGSFFSTIVPLATSFGTTTLTVAASATDSFVARASSAGAWTGAVQTTATAGSEVRATGIAVDCKGGLYITGSIRGTAVFGAAGPVVVPIGTGPTTFAAKLSPLSLAWIFVLSASLGLPLSSVAQPQAIATDCCGNVYIAGTFTGTVAFGTTMLTTVNPQAFVARFTDAGQWTGALQSVQASPGGAVMTTGVTANCQGNAYATGAFAGSVDFGTTSLVSAATGSNFDAWVADVVADTTIRTTGVSTQVALPGDVVTPVFEGTPSGNLYTGLIPAFDYFANLSGDLVAGCKCELCADPILKYVGTACSATQLILR